jgi:predicted dehydrogenase
MRALILGLGSMGKRRIRNLKHLGVHNITGYDTRADRNQYARDTYAVETMDDFHWDAVSAFDTVLICTPPEHHMQAAIECAKRGKHFFTELNFVKNRLDELLSILNARGDQFVAAPSCTLRYHPCVKKMQELLGYEPLGKPFCFIHHFGEYLPYWHPWESIHDFYVSKRQTGGARDIVAFDLEFLSALFGEPIMVKGFGSNTGALGVDIDDHFHFVISFESGVTGSVLVDVLQRKPNRYFRVVTENGTLIWDDWDQQRLKLIYEQQPAESPHVQGHEPIYVEEELDLSSEETDWAGSKFEKIDFSSAMYLEEMATFLDAVEGRRKYPKTFQNEKTIIDTLYQLEADHGDGSL